MNSILYRHFVLFLICLVAQTTASAQVSSNFELIDIFNLEYASDPQVSPDGSAVLYVRNFKDIMTDKNLSNIWIANVDGSAHHSITVGANSDRQPIWSPDGAAIAYVSNKSGSSQIYYRWLEAGHEAQLTNVKYGPSQLQFSPDGKYILFRCFVPTKDPSPIKMPDKPAGAEWNSPPVYIDELKYRADGQGYLKPGYTQLFVIPVNGGTARQLTEDAANHNNPQWHPDAMAVYFTSNLREDAVYVPNSEIYKLDINTLQTTAITDRFGPDVGLQFASNGKMAYLGYDDEIKGYHNSKLYVGDSDEATGIAIETGLDRSIDNFQWNAGNDGFIIQYTDNGRDIIAELDMEGNVNKIITDAGGLSLGRPYNAASFDARAGVIAYTQSDGSRPSDIYVIKDGVRKQLTDLNEDLSYKKWGAVKEITFTSSFDELPLQGWIVTPPDFDATKKYPMILEIHGGPFASYGQVFSAEIQLMASAGYVVLYMNPRGSTGYGDAFANKIDKNYPSQDYDDLMSGVDAVIAEGYIDDNRLYVTGGSGGGVLTSWIVGKTDRFKAAVVAKPVINWHSFVLYADNPSFFAKYWFGEMPWENPKAYMDRSPLSLVGNVSTPTMVLTGEQDYRTPIAESEQYYAALKLRKVESALVRIPNASHGIAAKPSNLIAKIAAILGWFEKYP